MLLASCDVNPTTIVRRETSLFRRALARILNCCEDLGVGYVGVDQSLLRNVVESTRSQDSPVEVARCWI
jgi:(2Fe-2S) ferredoxin